jgi:hypothetical protein
MLHLRGWCSWVVARRSKVPHVVQDPVGKRGKSMIVPSDWGRRRRRPQAMQVIKEPSGRRITVLLQGSSSAS